MTDWQIVGYLLVFLLGALVGIGISLYAFNQWIATKYISPHRYLMGDSQSNIREAERQSRHIWN